jgi:hypothetical protein
MLFTSNGKQYDTESLQVFETIDPSTPLLYANEDRSEIFALDTVGGVKFRKLSDLSNCPKVL